MSPNLARNNDKGVLHTLLARRHACVIKAALPLNQVHVEQAFRVWDLVVAFKALNFRTVTLDPRSLRHLGTPRAAAGELLSSAKRLARWLLFEAPQQP